MHILISKAVHMLPRVEKEDFAGAIKDLEMRIVSWITRWLSVITSVHIKKGKSIKIKREERYAGEIGVKYSEDHGRGHQSRNVASGS